VREVWLTGLELRISVAGSIRAKAKLPPTTALILIPYSLGDGRMQFKIKDIVKGNNAHSSFYRSGNMFYAVTVNGTKWIFPVSLEDIGGASLFAEMKAITLMRYIRKALDEKTFVKAA
jgi:hypothetical protein